MGKRQKASTSQHARAPHAPPSLSQLADVAGQLSSARREPRAAATAAKDRMGSLGGGGGPGMILIQSYQP